MKTNELNRFSPLFIRNKLFTNRVVVPAMASETANESGFVTDKTLKHYQQLSLSKAALVTVEYTFVDQTGRSEENQLGISSPLHLEGLKKLTQVIHREGVLAGIQLTHAGGKSERRMTGGKLMAPSAVIVPVKEKILEQPEEMTLVEINSWKISFIRGAELAIQAGFDLLEIHAAHGYGLNQWLSPLINKRRDDYGGSILKNSRLLIEIVSEIRRMSSELILSVRLPGQDFLDGGLTQEDSIFISKLLESAGVDIINVSSGIGGWRRPKERAGQGYLVNEASFVQSKIMSPVIGVGGIETADYIDSIIKNKNVSFAAVGRAILNNPQEWGYNNLRNL